MVCSDIKWPSETKTNGDSDVGDNDVLVIFDYSTEMRIQRNVSCAEPENDHLIFSF